MVAHWAALGLPSTRLTEAFLEWSSVWNSGATYTRTHGHHVRYEQCKLWWRGDGGGMSDTALVLDRTHPRFHVHRGPEFVNSQEMQRYGAQRSCPSISGSVNTGF